MRHLIVILCLLAGLITVTYAQAPIFLYDIALPDVNGSPKEVHYGNGKIYITDLVLDQIWVYDVQSNDFETPIPLVSTIDGTMPNAIGMTTDSNGNIWVTDIATLSVHVYSSAGIPLAVWGYGVAGPSNELQICTDIPCPRGAQNTSSADDWGFDFPYDVAHDSNGNVYILQAGTSKLNVQKYSSTGVPLTVFDVGTFFPTQLAINSSDQLFIPENVAPGITRQFSTAGVLELEIFSPGESDLPTGAHVDQLDRLWVTGRGANNAVRYDDAGNAVVVIDSAELETNSSSNQAISVTTSPDGRLWILNGPQRRLFVFDASVPDGDGDGVLDINDNCPLDANADQLDTDADEQGDACDSDDDNDNVDDGSDNCPLIANTAQDDSDGDGLGDVCDDSDGDGVTDDMDICPTGDDSLDADSDALPDACDACPLDIENDQDFDNICESTDNCPIDFNSDQLDSDGDGLGDACDSCAFDADNDADGDGLCGDIDAEISFRKTKVEFDNGKIKIDGSLSLPGGYWTDNLDALGSVQMTVAGVTLSAPSTGSLFVFDINGDASKKWEYEDKDLLSGDVSKLKIDWKGSTFDFHGEDGFKIKSVFIGGTESVLEIDVGNTEGALTVIISHSAGDTVINFDAARNVSSNVLFESDDDENEEVLFTLPYQLGAAQQISVSGAVSHNVLVGDFYDEGTVKFKLEAQVDPTLLPEQGDTQPQSLQLQLSLGDTVSGIGQIAPGEWGEIKSSRWKQ